MCLLTNRNIETSGKKITCYKVLIYRKKPIDKYTTPYRNANVSRDIIKGREIMYPDSIGALLTPAYENSYNNKCDAGFIHCFMNLKDALDEYNYWKSWEEYGQVRDAIVKVYECEVPVGVEYVIGDFLFSSEPEDPDYRECIATRELKFVREIKVKNK